MKAIRRSLKGDKEPRQQGHHPTNSIGPKSAYAIVPPKKVIKALYDYTPQNRSGQELAFNKGDFFHVLSRENDTEWYEACNPLIPEARGLVPVAYFEVIGKQQRTSDNSVGSSGGHDSGFSENGKSGRVLSSDSQATATVLRPSMQVQHSRAPSSAKAGAMVYGIVLYDFNAERPDELEAKMGEPIIVVAQSNPEWFVAKPIGRLGGPGLIPVSFVDIKDTTTGQSVTDPLDAVRKAGVPKVEEWKKTAAEYKNSSISLGKFDQAQQQVNTGMERMSIQQARNLTPGQAHYANAPLPQVPQQSLTGEHLPLAPVQASVPRYCFDNDMYWYIIECQMEDGRWWELSRYYADFYDFQVALLEAFPEEAGNRGRPRTVPFMPGPVAHVTDAISNMRRQNLDDYIKKIVAMPPHISRSSLVRNLFKPKPGQDFEIDPAALGEEYRLSSTSQNSLHQIQSRQSEISQQTPGSAYSGMLPPGHRSTGNHRPTQSYSAGPNGSGAPLLHTQASTLTQGSATSSIKQNNTGGALKIKVMFEGDNIVVRVPQDISFQSLKDRLINRLNVNEDIRLQYKDEASDQHVQMENDDNLEHAIAVNSKLQLRVTYANSGA